MMLIDFVRQGDNFVLVLIHFQENKTKEASLRLVRILVLFTGFPPRFEYFFKLRINP